MDTGQVDRHPATDQPARPACLVAGCPCKDARIVSHRRAAFFESLVDRFYAGVASDPVLRAIYPEPDDLARARHRLTLFLAQYWGGPRTYDAERGHPRLRMRHAPFAIGPVERDAWLTHMNAA